MELTKQIFDEKGYAYLQKKSGNLRDHANMMKTTKTCSKAITKEMLKQKKFNDLFELKLHTPKDQRRYERV